MRIAHMAKETGISQNHSLYSVTEIISKKVLLSSLIY